MNNDYYIDDSFSLLTYRLRDVFRHEDTANPDRTATAVAHVLGDLNVVDHSEPEGSPWRNRPAYHFDPAYRGEPLSDKFKADRQERLADIRRRVQEGTLPSKDWEKKYESPVRAKDWSKLGR